jgi:hypothetical protein
MAYSSKALSVYGKPYLDGFRCGYLDIPPDEAWNYPVGSCDRMRFVTGTLDGAIDADAGDSSFYEDHVA